MTEVAYISGYNSLLTFNNGAVRLVDFGPILEKARNPDTMDYRDLRKFRGFRIQEGDLVWGDYQMIFPILDLYHGTIFKGEEPAHHHFNEGGPPKPMPETMKCGSNVSYKKPLKRK